MGKFIIGVLVIAVIAAAVYFLVINNPDESKDAIDTIQEFDQEHQISEQAVDIAEAGKSALDNVGEFIEDVDEKYDVSGKVEEAGEFIGEKADELTDWAKGE